MSGTNKFQSHLDSFIIGMAQVSVANTNLDGSGTLVTITSGSTNGRSVSLIRVKAEATTTAGMIRLFIDDGADTWLYKEITVSAVTPGANTESFDADFSPTDLILPSGYTLKAATEQGETFTIFAFGGDY